MSRDGNDRGRRLVERQQFGFFGEEFFMNFSYCWRYITTFHLVNDRLIVFRKTFKDKLNLILMVNRFTKKHKLIEASSQILDVFVNALVTLGKLLQLLFELEDVSSARFGISRGKSTPHLGSGLGLGDK